MSCNDFNANIEEMVAHGYHRYGVVVRRARYREYHRLIKKCGHTRKEAQKVSGVILPRIRCCDYVADSDKPVTGRGTVGV